MTNEPSDNQSAHTGHPDCVTCKESTTQCERNAIEFVCPREANDMDCTEEMDCQICAIHRQMARCKEMLGNKIQEIDKKVDDLTKMVKKAIKER